MQYRHLFIGIMLTGVFFTSCTDESLVEGVLPEPIKRDLKTSTRSTSMITLDVWQLASVQVPPCNDEMPFSRQGDTKLETRSQPCFGSYGLTGEGGHGMNDELGSFQTEVNLEWDPNTKQIGGMIKYTFNASADILLLKTLGEARTMQTNEGTELVASVAYAKGTGIFANKSFKGELHVMQADQIFNGDHVEYPAKIIVQGSLVF